MEVGTQLIYNTLKVNKYVYNKLKINYNPYKIKDQVSQFKKIIEVYDNENINNFVSIDEISFVLNSKSPNGWFKKNEVNEI